MASAVPASAPVVIIKPHFALFYEYVPDVVERRQPHRQAHLALVKEFKDRGTFVMGGAMTDPVDSALIVFTDRQSAERFVLDDPYAAPEHARFDDASQRLATRKSKRACSGTFGMVSSHVTAFANGQPLCCDESCV
jgi:uncharacterized protein YciI